MFVYCVLKLPALSKDLKPLVAAIGPVQVDLCVASDRVRVSNWSASVPFEPHDFKNLPFLSNSRTHELP
jgi:hypothetical protein